MATHFGTFRFEHDTVLGDLLQIMAETDANVKKIHYDRAYPENWDLTLIFPTYAKFMLFVHELGRDPL
jgi:hypothetical protein